MKLILNQPPFLFMNDFCKQCSYYSVYNMEGNSLFLLYLPLPLFLQILPTRDRIFGSNYTNILEAIQSAPDCVSEDLIQDWNNLCILLSHAGYVVVKHAVADLHPTYRQSGLFPKTSWIAVPNNRHSTPPFSIPNV